jgi:penicillin-binding protein 1B
MAQKKTPAKKRTRSKKTSSRRKKQTGFISRSSLLKIAFTILVLLGLLTVFLDAQIRSQF